MQFTAEQIDANCCDDEFTAWAYWGAGLGKGEPRYVALARSINPDEDDGIYLERDDQIFCCKNGVLRCVLRCDSIRFELSVEGAEGLGLGGDSEIVIAMKPRPIVELWELRKALAVIFLGTGNHREDLT
jgi:hypothetical protein